MRWMCGMVSRLLRLEHRIIAAPMAADPHLVLLEMRGPSAINHSASILQAEAYV